MGNCGLKFNVIGHDLTETTSWVRPIPRVLHQVDNLTCEGERSMAESDGLNAGAGPISPRADSVPPESSKTKFGREHTAQYRTWSTHPTQSARSALANFVVLGGQSTTDRGRNVGPAPGGILTVSI